MTILDAQTSGPATEPRPRSHWSNSHAAHNYSPLPVVAASAEGAWITDVDGRRYLDCLAAYSAVNFGHRNPEITATAHAQLDTVTLVSRAFHSDKLGPFCAALARSVRQRHGAADELGRRSRGERPQGRPQVGRRRQGRPRGPGEHHRGRQQLPRPHDQHRQLLVGSRRRGTDSDRSPRVPLGAVRRRRGAGPRDRRRHRRGAARADPG